MKQATPFSECYTTDELIESLCTQLEKINGDRNTDRKQKHDLKHIVCQKFLARHDFIQKQIKLELPSISHLIFLFTKINKDIAEQVGSTEEEVPLTNSEYYAGQIAAIYDLDDEVAMNLAIQMAQAVADPKEPGYDNEPSNTKY